MVKEMSDRLVVRLDETTSTNTELKLLQKKTPLAEGFVVMTDYQTSGRGQMGNSWYSGKGKNLLLSILLYPHSVKARDQFIISRIVSLAIKKMLDRYLDNVTIKWPNDIYWNNKKIAGILIENSLAGQHIDYTILGIGLNVNEETFPKELPNPVSMKQISGTDMDREQLFKELYDELFELYELMERGGGAAIESEYFKHLFWRNGKHWFSDKEGRFEAVVKDVMSSGHLVLTVYPGNEERIYAFKEVAFEVIGE